MKKYVQKLKQNKLPVLLTFCAAVIVGAIFLYLSLTRLMPQSAIFFLDDINIPGPGEKVLVFSPHPDDETLGTGGFIYESTKKGAEVKIVLVTDGNKHGLKDLRYDEFKAATKTLGVNENNLVFLGYPDGGLLKQNQDELYARLKQEAVSFQPNVIVYPHDKDEHPDHATVAKVVDKIILDENFRGESYQYLIHHHYYPDHRRYQPGRYLLPPATLVEFSREWQKVLLPPDAESAKEKALRCYKSQLKTPILKGLMLSLVRRNEVYMIGSSK